jgi:serine/threonine protein kinase
MSVGRFPPIALALCETLNSLQKTETCYGLLNAETVFICLPTMQVRLVDGDPSSRFPRGSEHLRNTSSLPYLAPEQSGRIGRRLDARSDCYSLGVIFYQLLSGRLPFEAQDALEWVHAHLARVPDPPCLHNPDLPVALSDIVMKMLEKAPQRRYQSITGLQAARR